MRFARYAAGCLLLVIAACSANARFEAPESSPADAGGSPTDEGGTFDASDVDLDAEAPLHCGNAGFCETRLPKSDEGVPLSLQSVWLVAGDDVWSVTAEGFVLHYDGAAWKTDYRANHSLSSVWATTHGNVWAGGEGGLLLHRSADGAWTRVETSQTAAVRAIAGTSAEDVWFADDDGLVARFDGATLSPYSLDVPGLRITNVFTRPGAGMYAVGYVKGPPTVPVRWELPNLYPYVVELAPSRATVLNLAFGEQRGFVPVSAELANAPAEEPRILVVGYLYHFMDNVSRNGYELECLFGMVGVSGPVTLAPVEFPGRLTVMTSALDLDVPPRSPTWAKRWDDVVMPVVQPAKAIRLWRWDGTKQTSGSVAMGERFPPRPIFGVHGNATETWLVGDGMALRGTTP